MDFVTRIVGALVAFGATKLSAIGITLSPDAQAAVVVGAYGMGHRLADWASKRLGLSKAA